MPGTPQALVQMRDSMNTAGSTRSASNTQLTDDDAVRVVVRIRPMNDNEKGREEACVLEAQAGAKSLQVRTSGRESMKQYAFSKWGWWWLFFWRGGVGGGGGGVVLVEVSVLGKYWWNMGDKGVLAHSLLLFLFLFCPDMVSGPTTTQKQFFEGCGIRNLLDSALNGYAATAFAYGQTGSGKTFTIR